MAEEPLQFGDQSTADIKLQLIGSDETEYEGNPLYLHSQVLKKSEFYETLLSERWSAADKMPIEIHITSPHSNEDYIKCIQLMYSSQQGKHFCFPSVDEVLAILPVASQLLFHDCVKECMLYLDAVRWSPRQKANLRSADEYSARVCSQIKQWARNDALDLEDSNIHSDSKQWARNDALDLEDSNVPALSKQWARNDALDLEDSNIPSVSKQ